jgi:RNA polymerase sigma factor (sigma-70 family)
MNGSAAGVQSTPNMTLHRHSAADPEIEIALARCADGDAQGLDPLYRAFGDRVYRLARGILGNDADAADATQEVFLRVFRKCASFDRRSSFATWLWRLAYRQCLNHRRSLRRFFTQPCRDRADPSCDGARVAAGVEARDEVDRLFATLTREHRAILALRELLELDYREIAAALEIPLGTVMSRLSRARTELIARAGADVAHDAVRAASPLPRSS